MYTPPEMSNLTNPFDENIEKAYLSVDYLRKLKAKLDRQTRLLSELPAMVEATRKEFDAGMMFAPPGFDPDAPVVASPASKTDPRASDSPKLPESPKAKLPGNVLKAKPVKKVRAMRDGWPKALAEVLGEKPEGASYKEALAEGRARYNLPVSPTEKGFYHAVSRLLTNGVLVKHGGMLFHEKIFAKLKKNGAIPEIPPDAPREGTGADIVHRLLGTFPRGLTVAEMKTQFASFPNAPKSLTEHKHYIYNVLAPMVGSGVVVKDGEIYRRTDLKEAEK